MGNGGQLWRLHWWLWQDRGVAEEFACVPRPGPECWDVGGQMVTDSARLRATALAHAEVSWATMMRQPRQSPGLGAASRPFGHWRYLGAALGCLGEASSMFGRRGGTGRNRGGCSRAALAAPCLPGRPKMAQIASKMAQLVKQNWCNLCLFCACREGPRWPKMLPRWPKMLLRWPSFECSLSVVLAAAWGGSGSSGGSSGQLWRSTQTCQTFQSD